MSDETEPVREEPVAANVAVDQKITFEDAGSSYGGGDDLSGKIFVGGLSWQTTDEMLRLYFEKFGEVEAVDLMINKETGQPRFVEIVCTNGCMMECSGASFSTIFEGIAPPDLYLRKNVSHKSKLTLFSFTPPPSLPSHTLVVLYFYRLISEDLPSSR